MFNELVCRIFGKKNVKSSVRLICEPRRDDSLEMWRNFTVKAGWRKVAQVKERFVPFAFGEEAVHDNKIVELLSDRLTQVEQTVFTENFLRNNSSRVIFVDDGAPNGRVKEIVKIYYNGNVKFVVEESGKLRGFALSQDLILVGRVWVKVTPQYALSLVERQGVRLLNREDSAVVEKNLPSLVKMMEEAEVPTLRDVLLWLLENAKDCKDMFDCYDLRHGKRLGSAEADDLVVVVCKL